MTNQKVIYKQVETTTNLFLCERQLQGLDVEYFIDKIKKNINENISYETNVRNKMTNWNCFINDVAIEKIFANMNSLVSILKLPSLKLDNCWGTWSSNYVETYQHKHTPSMMSGVLYLTEGGPGTFFPQFNINIKEKIGKLVFFHGDTLHMVKKHKLKKDRFLISFNFNELKFWEENNGRQR
jgi:hypothetical protein